MEYGSPYKQLTRKVNTWCKYTKRIDTYGLGCQHDCKYCYAKGLLEFRKHWNPSKPAKSNLLKIKNAIKMLAPGDIVRLGSMTDCFQPIEKTERVTYNTILLLNQFRIGYLIVTKSALVADDLYLHIYDKQLAHFQITITSTHDTDYENASPVIDRINAIERLYLSGFDVCLRLSPFISENINPDVLNAVKCNKILIEFLKVNHWIRKRFDIDYSKYTHKFGGYDHLPLELKIELIKKINGFKQVSIGEYVKEHHEYFSKNVNFNKSDCCNLAVTRDEVNHKQLTIF